MSKEIDEKVVVMRFDNSQFEKNVQTSISSLERLKSKLDFSSVNTGLDNISASMDDTNVRTTALGSEVEEVGSKFSAMEVIAITALANITNSVTNAGKQMVKSLTVDQLAAGFSKYEQKTTAVQTIVNATGKPLQEVNSQLEKLNWFTDETSYNFIDMVSNIGKFTSMGIDLGTSVTAMMGIANWAALSGQGTMEASRAMYNLSQAIGVGAVKLQDWKSIENANMATKEFKDIAIETAKALGTLDAEAKTTGGTLVESTNFSMSLSEGWFTGDVLLAALQKYGNYSEEIYKVASEEGLTAAEAMEIVSEETMELGAKAFKAAQEAKTFTDAINATKDAVSTGWLNTFEIIFGNYEEAKVLWTDLANELYDIFASSAEDRNELLSEWKEMGGRTKLIEGFYNALTILKNVIQTVKDAFHDIFPPATAEGLYRLSELFYNFTETIKNNTGAFDAIKRVLKGLFAILSIGKQLVGSMLKALTPIFKTILDVAGGILGVAASIGDLLVGVDETIKRTKIFDKVFQAIANVLMVVINGFKNFFIALKQSSLFTVFANLLNKVCTTAKEFFDIFKEKFSMPGLGLIDSILQRIGYRLSQVGEVFSALKNVALNAINSIGNELTGSLIFNILSKIWSVVVDIAKCISGLLVKAVSTLSDKLSTGDFNGLFDILNAVSFTSISIAITKFLKSFTDTFSGVKDILTGVTDIFDGVRGCLEAYQTKIKAGTLIKIASAIAILTASILVLSLIDSEKLYSAIIAMTELFAGLMISMSLLTNMSGNIAKAAKTNSIMLGMSVSILILASALKKLSTIDSDGLVNGLIGMVGLMTIMIAFVEVMRKGTKTIVKGTTQLVVLALALKILASVCQSLAKLSWSELKKGLVGVGVLLAEVAAFLKLATFNKKSFSTVAGIVLLATAIKILSSSCKIFANMSIGEILKGLSSVAGILLALGVFTRIVKPKRMISTGLGMIGIATAVRILASSMKAMVALSWEQIGKGLAAMAGSLVAVAAAMWIMPKGMISKGLGLIAVASALLVLGSVVKKMGSMDWMSIIRSITMLGGTMAILAIGLHAMKGTLSGVASLLVASAAIAILAPALLLLGSMSWKSMGVGLITLAGAIAILGVAALVLTPIIPALLGLSAALALLGIGMFGIGAGLLSLSAGLTGLAAAGAAGATSLVASLTIILTGIVQLIPTVANALAKGVLEFVKTILKAAPKIINSFESILLSLLSLIRNVAPELISTLFYLLSCALQTLVEYTPTIIQAVLDMLMACLEALTNNMGMIVQKGVDIVIAFINGITSKIPDIVQAAFNLIINFINGLSEALVTNSTLLADAVFNLVESIITAMINCFKAAWDRFVDIGKNIINGIIEGIKGAYETIKQAIIDLGDNIKNWFCETFGIHSPSKVFQEYGQYLDEGLANGINSYAGSVEDATTEVGDKAIGAMAAAVKKVSDIASGGEFSEPTIRPVMDLTEIQNGAGQINQMMNGIDGYSLSGSYNLAQNVQRDGNISSTENDNSILGRIAKSIQNMANTANNQPQNVTSTFYINGNNAEEIAEEVSKIIENKVLRKKVEWA